MRTRRWQLNQSEQTKLIFCDIERYQEHGRELPNLYPTLLFDYILTT